MKEIPLSTGEYYTGKYPKTQIYLHHTAGGHRPDWTIAGWNADRSKSGGHLPVATSYVIGGKSITDGNSDWDGVLVRCFPDDMWAHHLGLHTANNELLNKGSVAIETCNYGPLTLSKDGRFYNYVNKPVPDDMVVELDKPYKGYKYYHRYTEKQLDSLRSQIIELAKKYSIPTNYNPGMFEVSQEALSGKPGVWSHTSVRADKFDMCPQPLLIEMLKSIC